METTTAFVSAYEHAKDDNVVELTVSPPSLVGAVKAALKGYVDTSHEAILGDLRVKDLDRDQLASALGGVGVVAGWKEAA
jgi:hypothetical protein